MLTKNEEKSEGKIKEPTTTATDVTTTLANIDHNTSTHYGPIKGQPILPKPIGFNPLGQQISSTMNNNHNNNITTNNSINNNNNILTQNNINIPNKPQKQINQYQYWPPYTSEYQQNIVYHPLGWPIDPNYPYQISNYLSGNTINNFNNIMSQYLKHNGIAMANSSLNLSLPGKQYTLFVFHIPHDIDNNGLLHLFRPFGALQSHVICHSNGKSRGYGFVHFNTKAEAQIAIDMMNGYQIGKKRLKVSFKKDNERSKKIP